MAATDQDRVQSLEVAPSSGGSFALSLRTQDEEFEVFLDGEMLQQLADKISRCLGKGGPKRA